MTENDETDSDDRMGRADRIRNTREGRRSQSRRSRSDADSDESENQQTESQTSQPSQPSQNSQNSQKTQTSQISQRDGESMDKQPVKDRPHRTVYLPSALDEEFESQIDRIQYEAKHETEGEKVQLAKNRHVYPLLVHLGLERANNMAIDELLATLTETDTLDTPDR
jgi:negative regulator of genetic competence, sporulation and motility